MKSRMFTVAFLAIALFGCASNTFTVMVECHRPDGLLAFYGPAEKVVYQTITGGNTYWVVYNASGFLGTNTFIPPECSCFATERISK